MTSHFVVPGELVCRQYENVICGEGIYTYEGNVMSKAAGYVVKEEQPNGKLYISISNIASSKTPYIDCIVLARITSITSTLARAEIVCVENRILEHTYKSIIRREAIRSYLRDQAEPSKSFGLGDIIRAKVVNITGSKSEGGFSYLLSTAEPKCGVIYAINESSKMPMIPISETQMLCMKTDKVVLRKVAEVNLDFINELAEHL